MKRLRQFTLVFILALGSLLLYCLDVAEATPLAGQGGGNQASGADFPFWLVGALVAMLIVATLSLVYVRRHKN